jgi:alkyl hydroperoxide reductase subunit AhpF
LLLLLLQSAGGGGGGGNWAMDLAGIVDGFSFFAFWMKRRAWQLLHSSYTNVNSSVSSQRAGHR